MSVRYGGEGEIYSTIIATVTHVNGTEIGLAVGGNVEEGVDYLGLEPFVGEAVLADWLPCSTQWVIVGRPTAGAAMAVWFTVDHPVWGMVDGPTRVRP